MPRRYPTPPAPTLAAAPAAPRDEPHQRGDSNLLETNNLSTIAAHVLSGGLVPADYQSRVLCLTDWRRKGAEYDLAPLARQFPSSNRPDFEHISRASFDAAFALDPGGLKLTEVRGLRLPAGCTGGELVGLRSPFLPRLVAKRMATHDSSFARRQRRATCSRPTWAALARLLRRRGGRGAAAAPAAHRRQAAPRSS